MYFPIIGSIWTVLCAFITFLKGQQSFQKNTVTSTLVSLTTFYLLTCLLVSLLIDSLTIYLIFKSGNPEILPGGVQNEKKLKIPKLCQDIGLDELFLEKILLVRLDFYFRRTATKSIWRLSLSHSRRAHHTLLEHRLKINTRVNPTIKHHNQKNAYLGIV